MIRKEIRITASDIVIHKGTSLLTIMKEKGFPTKPSFDIVQGCLQVDWDNLVSYTRGVDEKTGDILITWEEKQE